MVNTSWRENKRCQTLVTTHQRIVKSLKNALDEGLTTGGRRERGGFSEREWESEDAYTQKKEKECDALLLLSLEGKQCMIHEVGSVLKQDLCAISSFLPRDLILCYKFGICRCSSYKKEAFGVGHRLPVDPTSLC